jgi:hypothetical protein
LSAGNEAEAQADRCESEYVFHIDSSDLRVRIPMMSIRSERSDAGLSQFETLIDIRQEFSLPSLS